MTPGSCLKLIVKLHILPESFEEKIMPSSTKPATKKAPIKTSTTKPTAAPKSAPSAKPAQAVQKKPLVEKSISQVAPKPPLKTDPKPASKPVSKPVSKKIIVTDEQRYRMVAEAAYYRAESNQFKSDPLRDWIDAESDIETLLNGKK